MTLLSKNDAPVPHDISIKGGGVDEQGDQVTDGGTSKLSVRLKPGKYTYYCSVPGHEQGGMKGTLAVKNRQQAQALSEPRVAPSLCGRPATDACSWQGPRPRD